MAQAIEIYDVLTRHLSQSDSKVILHTYGEKGVSTLNLPNFGGTKPIRQKVVLPPKMRW